MALEDVQNGKGTPDTRFGSFVSGLLYRNLHNINPGNVEFLLRQPDCAVASAASDVQCLAGSNRVMVTVWTALWSGLPMSQGVEPSL